MHTPCTASGGASCPQPNIYPTAGPVLLLPSKLLDGKRPVNRDGRIRAKQLIASIGLIHCPRDGHFVRVPRGLGKGKDE